MRIALALLLVLCCVASAGAAVPEPSPLHTFSFPVTLTLQAKVYPVYIKDAGADFLDHRVSGGMNLLLARNQRDGFLYCSTDMSHSWIEVPNSNGSKWQKGFVTEEGNFLVWEGKQLVLMDQKGKVLATHPDAPWMWQGSEGIGQSGKTIMYAEYSVHEAKELRVFRSEDAGRTWSVVFRQPTDMSATPEIEHFHLVQPDPYYPGYWYLSSGDVPAHSRVWRSKDDGRNWMEVTDPKPTGTEKQSIHRFTALIFTQDHLYWATDDRVQDGQAVMVKATRGEPLKTEVIGAVGDECIRNTVLTDYGFLLISEAKNLKSAGANIVLFTPSLQTIRIGAIPRGVDPTLKTGVTLSLGSKAAVGGQFFTLATGTTQFPCHTRLLRWFLQPWEETDVPEGQP